MEGSRDPPRVKDETASDEEHIKTKHSTLLRPKTTISVGLYITVSRTWERDSPRLKIERKHLGLFCLTEDVKVLPVCVVYGGYSHAVKHLIQ